MSSPSSSRRYNLRGAAAAGNGGWDGGAGGAGRRQTKIRPTPSQSETQSESHSRSRLRPQSRSRSRASAAAAAAAVAEPVLNAEEVTAAGAPALPPRTPARAAGRDRRDGDTDDEEDDGDSDDKDDDGNDDRDKYNWDDDGNDDDDRLRGRAGADALRSPASSAVQRRTTRQSVAASMRPLSARGVSSAAPAAAAPPPAHRAPSALERKRELRPSSAISGRAGRRSAPADTSPDVRSTLSFPGAEDPRQGRHTPARAARDSEDQTSHAAVTSIGRRHRSRPRKVDRDQDLENGAQREKTSYHTTNDNARKVTKDDDDPGMIATISSLPLRSRGTGRLADSEIPLVASLAGKRLRRTAAGPAPDMSQSPRVDGGDGDDGENQARDSENFAASAPPATDVVTSTASPPETVTGARFQTVESTRFAKLPPKAGGVEEGPVSDAPAALDEASSPPSSSPPAVRATSRTSTQDTLGAIGSTRDELRNACRDLGLAVGGSKAELEQRIENYLTQGQQYSSPLAVRASSRTSTQDTLSAVGSTRDELRNACRSLGLVARGNKKELERRIENAIAQRQQDSPHTLPDSPERRRSREGTLPSDRKVTNTEVWPGMGMPVFSPSADHKVVSKTPQAEDPSHSDVRVPVAGHITLRSFANEASRSVRDETVFPPPPNTANDLQNPVGRTMSIPVPIGMKSCIQQAAERDIGGVDRGSASGSRPEEPARLHSLSIRLPWADDFPSNVKPVDACVGDLQTKELRDFQAENLDLRNVDETGLQAPMVASVQGAGSDSTPCELAVNDILRASREIAIVQDQVGVKGSKSDSSAPLGSAELSQKTVAARGSGDIMSMPVEVTPSADLRERTAGREILMGKGVDRRLDLAEDRATVDKFAAIHSTPEIGTDKASSGKAGTSRSSVPATSVEAAQALGSDPKDQDRIVHSPTDHGHQPHVQRIPHVSGSGAAHEPIAQESSSFAHTLGGGERSEGRATLEECQESSRDLATDDVQQSVGRMDPGSEADEKETPCSEDKGSNIPTTEEVDEPGLLGESGPLSCAVETEATPPKHQTLGDSSVQEDASALPDETGDGAKRNVNIVRFLPCTFDRGDEELDKGEDEDQDEDEDEDEDDMEDDEENEEGEEDEEDETEEKSVSKKRDRNSIGSNCLSYPASFPKRRDQLWSRHADESDRAIDQPRDATIMDIALDGCDASRGHGDAHIPGTMEGEGNEVMTDGAIALGEAVAKGDTAMELDNTMKDDESMKDLDGKKENDGARICDATFGSHRTEHAGDKDGGDEEVVNEDVTYERNASESMDRGNKGNDVSEGDDTLKPKDVVNEGSYVIEEDQCEGYAPIQDEGRKATDNSSRDPDAVTNTLARSERGLAILVSGKKVVSGENSATMSAKVMEGSGSGIRRASVDKMEPRSEAVLVPDPRACAQDAEPDVSDRDITAHEVAEAGLDRNAEGIESRSAYFNNDGREARETDASVHAHYLATAYCGQVSHGTAHGSLQRSLQKSVFLPEAGTFQGDTSQPTEEIRKQETGSFEQFVKSSADAEEAQIEPNREVDSGARTMRQRGDPEDFSKRNMHEKDEKEECEDGGLKDDTFCEDRPVPLTEIGEPEHCAAQLASPKTKDPRELDKRELSMTQHLVLNVPLKKVQDLSEPQVTGNRKASDDPCSAACGRAWPAEGVTDELAESAEIPSGPSDGSRVRASTTEVEGDHEATAGVCRTSLNQTEAALRSWRPSRQQSYVDDELEVREGTVVENMKHLPPRRSLSSAKAGAYGSTRLEGARGDSATVDPDRECAERLSSEPFSKAQSRFEDATHTGNLELQRDAFTTRARNVEEEHADEEEHAVDMHGEKNVTDCAYFHSSVENVGGTVSLPVHDIENEFSSGSERKSRLENHSSREENEFVQGEVLSSCPPHSSDSDSLEVSGEEGDGTEADKSDIASAGLLQDVQRRVGGYGLAAKEPRETSLRPVSATAEKTGASSSAEVVDVDESEDDENACCSEAHEECSYESMAERHVDQWGDNWEDEYSSLHEDDGDMGVEVGDREESACSGRRRSKSRESVEASDADESDDRIDCEVDPQLSDEENDSSLNWGSSPDGVEAAEADDDYCEGEVDPRNSDKEDDSERKFRSHIVRRKSLETPETKECDERSESEVDPLPILARNGGRLNVGVLPPRPSERVSNGSSNGVEIVHDNTNDTAEVVNDADREADLRVVERVDIDIEHGTDSSAGGDPLDKEAHICKHSGSRQLSAVEEKGARPRPSFGSSPGSGSEHGIEGRYPEFRMQNPETTRPAEALAELSVQQAPVESDFLPVAEQGSLAPCPNREQDDTVGLGSERRHFLLAGRRESQRSIAARNILVDEQYGNRDPRSSLQLAATSLRSEPVFSLQGDLPTPDSTIDNLRSTQYYKFEARRQMEPSRIKARVHGISRTPWSHQESGHLLARLERIELSLDKRYPAASELEGPKGLPPVAAAGRTRLWSQVDVRSATYEEPRVIRVSASGAWDVPALASQTAARANSLGDTVRKWKGWSQSRTPHRGQAELPNVPAAVGVHPIGTTPIASAVQASRQDTGESTASAKKRRRI